MSTTCIPAAELMSTLSFKKFLVRGENKPEDTTFITVSRRGAGSFRFPVTHHYSHPVQDRDLPESLARLCEEITATHPKEGRRDFESASYIPTHFSNVDHSTYSPEDYRRLITFRLGLESQLKLSFEDIQELSTFTK